MPFKTRGRKIAAVERRFDFLETLTVNYESPSKGEKHLKAKAQGLRADTSIEDYRMVRHDLIKTAALALIVVATQIILRTFLKI